MRHAAVVITLVLGAAGCGRGLKEGAQKKFGQEFSCPDDRVVARERSDLTGADILLGPPQVETPSAEVKSDPARLAKWEADRREALKTSRGYLDNLTVFEVNGCGHRAFYGCARANKVNGNADPVGCFPGRFPPPE